MTRPLLALLLTLALPLHAALNDAPDFSDPVENTRYQHLIQNIRCPTCQNSNIAESNAPLARQLREQVAARIRDGESDADIHYDPPLKTQTLLLWGGAPAVMLIALALWLAGRRRKTVARLTEEEKQQLQQWIEEAS